MAEINVRGLHFGYHQNQKILKQIDLHFKGKSTAIIGQNGAGKTTLVKLFKGLLKPVKGDILINSINTKEITAAKLANQIGLVFQNPNDQIFKSNVMDEVKYGPLMIGFTEKEANIQADLALEAVGLKGLEQVNPYDLNLYERKMISIASILAMDTPIVIFDEPTMGQDYQGKERIKAIINHLRAQGKLVLSILHDMDFVAEVFERTIVMKEGQILLDGETREVFAEAELLKEAYLEQPHVTQIGRGLGAEQVFLNERELIDWLKNKRAML
ncbi:cobalt ABC transporter ATP-binding protein [Oceanobacillus arenosus]|uniref:Cobalt ABC transporter ATP-binding protein n=2 Tax=Oceanobacillus arenosus TaxID=1229153 RepID=A0A3D8PP36_9BACI|nr:cobalt ABC transporter ATP-binding protein [Oceanobacillus arenosus]